MACVSITRLRFGIVSEPVRGARQWLDFARRADDSGIDMLSARCQGQKVMPTPKGTHNNQYGSGTLCVPRISSMALTRRVAVSAGQP
jgi:hypothetical protein